MGDSQSREAALRAYLVQRVEGTKRSARLRLGATAGVVVIGAAGALALANTKSAPIQDNGVLHCRSGVSVSSVDVMAQMGSAVPDSQLPSAASEPNPKFGDARAMCEALWRQGVLTVGADFPQDVARPSVGQLPPLLVCVGDDDVPVVVPGIQPAVCSALGLALGN